MRCMTSTARLTCGVYAPTLKRRDLADASIPEFSTVRNFLVDNAQAVLSETPDTA
jgi:hypothetical protein